MENVLIRKDEGVKKSLLMHILLRDTKIGWVWVVPRVWLGAQLTQAAQQKIIDPQWVQTGEAFKRVWLNAAQASAGGRPSIVFDEYHAFLQMMLDAQAYTWFARLVAYGELLMGLALMVGAFTGLMALFGGLVYWNFIVVGAASANPLLFVIAVALIMAWKVSGYYGADYYLLRSSTARHGAHVKTETRIADTEALMAWADDVGNGSRS